MSLLYDATSGMGLGKSAIEASYFAVGGVLEEWV